MFWQNFMALCAKAKMPPSRVVEEIGLKKAAVTSWKNGATPRDSTLYRIADYFGVTVDELTEDEKSPSAPGNGGGQAEVLTGEETRFLNAARRMRPEQRAFLLELVEAAVRNAAPEIEPVPARLAVSLPADAGTPVRGSSNP